MGSSPPPPPPPPASAATDDDRYQDPMWERPTHARILVGDNDAGRIIGKAGSSIAAMEADSGARITLSGRAQLLAGTDRRVVFLSGPFRAVMDAAELVLHKILCQGDQVVDAEATVVLVVPDACCGTLIGKGGTLIKSLAEASNAGITVSHHRICYGFNDRLVKITGHMDNQLQAIFLILSELLDDVHYLSSYESVGFPRYHVSSVGRDGDGQDDHVERYHSRPDTLVGCRERVRGRRHRPWREGHQGDRTGYGRVDQGVQGGALAWDEGKRGGDQRDAGGGGCCGGDDRGAHLVRHGSPRAEAGW